MISACAHDICIKEATVAHVLIGGQPVHFGYGQVAMSGFFFRTQLLLYACIQALHNLGAVAIVGGGAAAFLRWFS